MDDFNDHRLVYEFLAVLVARSHDVDSKEIARWSRQEGMAARFAAIAQRFE